MFNLVLNTLFYLNSLTARWWTIIWFKVKSYFQGYILRAICYWDFASKSETPSHMLKLTSFSNDPLYKTPITAPVITILVPTFSSIGFIGKKNWFQVLTCKLLYYKYILGHCKGVANLFCNINIYREVLTHFPIF